MREEKLQQNTNGDSNKSQRKNIKETRFFNDYVEVTCFIQA